MSIGFKVKEEEPSTRGDDERQARDRGRFWNFASWRSGFLWRFQLVSNAPRCSSSEGRPGACAVAPEPDALQVGNHSVYCEGEQWVKWGFTLRSKRACGNPCFFSHLPPQRQPQNEA